MGAHPAAGSEVAATRAAAVGPPNEQAAGGKAAQVGDMDAAPPGTFDKAAFIRAVEEAIARIAPGNLNEAKDFASSGKADAIKGAVTEKVTAGKSAATGNVADATEAPPDPSRGASKPVTPLPPPPAVSRPASIGAAGAMPKAMPAAATDLSAPKRDVDAEIWDAATGDELADLSGHTGTITFLQWGADDESLLTASEDGTVRIWDVASGTTSRVLDEHVGIVRKMHWVTGERRELVTASLDGTARVWDVATGATTLVYGEVGDSGVWSLSSEHADLRLATGHVSGDVKLWNEATGEFVATLRGHSAPVIWTSAAQDRIMALAADGTVRIFDAVTLTELAVFSE